MVRNAKRTTLTLRHDAAPAAASRALQLASGAADLALVLKGGVHASVAALAAQLAPRTTRLSLRSMQLTHALASGLAQQLPQLSSLALEDCDLTALQQAAAAFGQPIRSVDVLRCRAGNERDSARVAGLALGLVRRGDVRALDTTCNLLGFGLGEALPQLHSATLRGSVRDVRFLLDHPALQHVTLHHLHPSFGGLLRPDRQGRPQHRLRQGFQWQSLTLPHGHALNLTALPLAKIERLVFQDGVAHLDGWRDGGKAWGELEAAARAAGCTMACEPSRQTGKFVVNGKLAVVMQSAENTFHPERNGEACAGAPLAAAVREGGAVSAAGLNWPIVFAGRVRVCRGQHRGI